MPRVDNGIWEQMNCGDWYFEEEDTTTPFDDVEMEFFLKTIRWTREASLANRISQYDECTYV